MPGDYSRFSDQPRKRFSALFMQQGRVQLDADWNESVAILRRRIEREANDIFGPAAVPRAIDPDGFLIAFTGTAAAPDLTVAPGRIYVDGILVECFDGENVTYAKQPYLPAPPPLAGVSGDVLVYLDVWQREVTAVEDPSIVDSALGGIDTGTRLQTVWQVKLAPPAEGSPVTCDVDFGSLFPPSGGRLSTRTVPRSEAPDPCSLPDAGGYQGVDNRFYRVEVHDPAKGLFKWSRDNGSVTSAVVAMAHGATATTLTVARVGRDEDLGFRPNDWVEIVDDVVELAGRAGVMAMVTLVDPAARALTLDRSIASAGFDPGGANRLRVRRWDQKDGVDPATGLLTASPTAWVSLENGIEVQLTVVAGGALHVGDAWVFAARASDALVEVLTAEPPRSIVHHYCALGTVKGLGGTATPTVGDCRVPWPPLGTGADDCSCTVCVQAVDHNTGKLTIQQAIEQVKHTGGTVCLGVGIFELESGVVLEGATAVRIRGQGASTVLHFTGQGVALGVRASYQIEISDLAIQCELQEGVSFQIGIALETALIVSVTRCEISASSSGRAAGVGVALVGYLAAATVRDNLVVADMGVIALASIPKEDGGGEARTFLSSLSTKSRQLAGFYDLDVSSNWLICQRYGIRWVGQLVYGSTFVASNWVSCAGPAIGIMGAATGGPLQIVGNDVVSGAGAIVVLCNDVALLDNVITGSAQSSGAPAGGILLESGSDEEGLGLVNAIVERNQITSFPGNGITFTGDAQRLVVRGNVIDQVGGGIVMSDESTGEEVVIDGNDLRDIGSSQSFAPLADGTLGIATVRTGSLLIRGNTLTNVGAAVTDGSFITGIRVVQATRSSVDDNVIQSIGAGGTSTSRTLGIEVFGTFNEARVRGNRVQASTSGDTLPFTGIAIASGRKEIVDNARRFRAVPLDDSRVMLTTPASYMILIATGQQDADVSGNGVDAIPSSQALVRAVVGGAATCRGNRVAVVNPFRPSNDPPTLPTGAWATSAIELYALTLIASDNHVNTYRGQMPGMVLGTPGERARVTVLGNVSTTGITLNGAALAAPWAPLNVES